MDSVPEFVTLPRTAVSGRLVRNGAPTTGDPSAPVVLEAHLLPALIGSSVYVLGAVGASDTTWPFFPRGGVVVSDHGEMTLLEMDDDSAYWFATGEKLTFELDEPVDNPQELIDLVLGVATDALHLRAWDAALVADALGECEGDAHFDEFMALPVAQLPGTE